MQLKLLQTLARVQAGESELSSEPPSLSTWASMLLSQPALLEYLQALQEDTPLSRLLTRCSPTWWMRKP